MVNFTFSLAYLLTIPNLPTQYFSVKWVGQLLAPTTETYRLTIDVFNTTQVQLILNGQSLITNDFTGIGTPGMYADVEFTQGVFYSIEVHYAQKIGPSKLSLLWESDSMDFQVINSTYLYNTLSSQTVPSMQPMPYILQVNPDISNATTSALTDNGYQVAIVNV